MAPCSCATTPGKNPIAKSISPRSNIGRGSRVVKGTIRTSIPGASLSINRTSRGNKIAAVASAIAIRNVTCAFANSNERGATASSNSASARLTAGHKDSARAVGLTPWAVLINNSSLKASRSRLMALDTAGCVIASRPAARVRFCSVITASKTRSRFKSRVKKLMIA